MDVDANVMKLANISGDISIQKNQTGNIIFKGKKKLAFGVELYELKYIQNDGKDKFQMYTPNKPVVARGEKEQSQGVLLGDDDGDATISIIDK
jgi:hypothetical protein